MIDPQIIGEIRKIKSKSYAVHNVDPLDIAKDLVSEESYEDQLRTLMKFVGEDISGKKLLEIGSGFGMLLVLAKERYGLGAYGIEPEPKIYKISLRLFEGYGIKPIIVQGFGESLPFKDEIFDFVFSANVLEHTRSPERVFSEALRVLTKGGFLHFIIPNFNSFFEGHYGVWWIPGMPRFLSKLYVQFLYRRDSTFIDTLQFTTYQMIKNILKTHKDIEILGWGEQEWKRRMQEIRYPEWKDNGRLGRTLKFIKKLKLLRPLITGCLLFKLYTPLIITLRKKEGV